MKLILCKNYNEKLNHEIIIIKIIIFKIISGCLLTRRKWIFKNAVLGVIYNFRLLL